MEVHGRFIGGICLGEGNREKIKEIPKLSERKSMEVFIRVKGLEIEEK